MRNGFSLAPAAEADFRELMTWFGDAHSTRVWGGPEFRFPFNFDTFKADARWPGMASWCLRNGGKIAGFGQYYDRYHRIHLARLVVNPACRGQGVGKRLLALLMEEAARTMEQAEFSLFVYRDNPAAIACYKAMGFERAEPPQDAPLREVTYYMIRRMSAGIRS